MKPLPIKRNFITATELKISCELTKVIDGVAICLPIDSPLFKSAFHTWLDREVSEEWNKTDDIVKMRPAKQVAFYMTKKEYKKL